MADAALGVALDRLVRAILDVKDRAIDFKPIFDELESRVTSIRPMVSEIERLDRGLGNPVSETKMLTDQLAEAADLVNKCSEIQWWNYFAKVYYSTKLKELDDKLVKLLQTNVQVVQTKESKRILVKVNEMDAKLDRMCPSMFVGSCGAPGVPEFIVGLDEPFQDLKTRLLRDGEQVVVLSAPGGFGKTTLAKMLCHDVEIKAIFMDNIFFVTVSKTPNLKLIVENMFQHKYFWVPTFQDDADALNKLEVSLLNQIGPDPVLLVLDDVWYGQESLIQRFMFRIPGYKILVTSRSDFPIFDSTYRLGLLSEQYAMDLFRRSAFPPGGSINMPEDLVHQIVRVCRGFPIALTMVGGSLSGKPEVIWRRTLNQWSEGQSIFDSHRALLIHLKTSIDDLAEDTNVKECFLDLGSFPEGKSIPATALMDMWVELYNLDEDGIHALANIYELAFQNLVNVVFTRKDVSAIDGYYSEHFVTQLDLFRDLAIHQSNQERIEQRKRLMHIRGNDLSNWSIEQIQPFHAHLLSIYTDETLSSSWHNLQLPEIEVLILNLWTMYYSLPNFMENMDQLKVLIVTSYGSCQAELRNFQLLGLLSSLKRIRLEHVSFSFLSESTLQFRNLRKMSLIMCKIGETFRNSKVSYAYMFPNLVEIDFHCCSGLVELPEGLCDIISLKKLSITKCNDLEALPERLGRLTNLEVLRLHYCTGLMGLPESVVSLHKLRFLDISYCLYIGKLPIQIGELRSLETLDMRSCCGLLRLPPSVKDLGQLKDVICDEDTVHLWEPFNIHLNSHQLPNLRC